MVRGWQIKLWHSSVRKGFDHISSDSSNHDLKEEYEKIKRAGFYIKYEKENDFYCIAVPLLNSAAHVIGDVSVVVPNCRYSDALRTKITEKLMETASVIRKSL